MKTLLQRGDLDQTYVYPIANAFETDKTTQKVFVEREGEEKVFLSSSARLHKNFIQSTHKSCAVRGLTSRLELGMRCVQKEKGPKYLSLISSVQATSLRPLCFHAFCPWICH